MLHTSRLFAIAIAAMYSLVGLLLLLTPIYGVASMFSTPSNEGPSAGAMFLVGVVPVVVASVFFASAVGLVLEKRWVRWPLAAIALLTLVFAIQALLGLGLFLNQYLSPRPDDYVVLTQANLLSFFGELVLPYVLVCVFAIVAAVFGFTRA